MYKRKTPVETGVLKFQIACLMSDKNTGLVLTLYIQIMFFPLTKYCPAAAFVKCLENE
jgi:hypothetical protein